jgi:hypothetical protein
VTCDYLANLRAGALGEDRDALYGTFARNAREVFDARHGFAVPRSFGEPSQPPVAAGEGPAGQAGGGRP